MAKQIYIPQNEIDNILDDVKNQIMSMKTFGSIDIKKNFAKDKRTVSIYFNSDAWNKLNALVREFDTEVQWHGCVSRINDNEFVIYDILVPPHAVTGSTVTSDIHKYTEWLNNLDDDVFNSLHFHGHSHVNMACSPSSIDMKYRQDVVTQLPIPSNEDEDSFYIFLIFNKKGEWTGEVYDLKNNALYGTSEITIDAYMDNGLMLSDFIAVAKTMAVKEVVAQNYTPYSYCWEKEESAKQKNGREKKTYSLFGKKSVWDTDTADEYDPTSPFYVREY